MTKCTPKKVYGAHKLKEPTATKEYFVEAPGGGGCKELYLEPYYYCLLQELWDIIGPHITA